MTSLLVRNPNAKAIPLMFTSRKQHPWKGREGSSDDA